MSEVEVCECCGQKIRKLNPHRMCKAKVQMLEILEKAGGWVRLDAGTKATDDMIRYQAPYRAQAHAGRLVWFGLAERDEHWRSGKYRITPEGRAFLRGEYAVPDLIWTKDGKVVDRSPKLVTIGSVKDVVLDKEYWDNYPRSES